MRDHVSDGVHASESLKVPYGREYFEEFLQGFNETLSPFQEDAYRELPEEHPNLHVIGLPRSGTTVLTQLIASHLDVGYINNLIASFWRAPCFGIRLSERLLKDSWSSSLESECGRTEGIREPHEFGYFWRDLLRYDDLAEGEHGDIDWQRVRKVLINITHAFGRPVVFKSFLLAWHLREMAEILPKTCVVYIRRDPTEAAVSLLKFRRRLFGDVERWGSVKPKEYSWLRKRPYWEQVAGQIAFLKGSFEEGIAGFPKERLVEVEYDEVVADPQGVLKKVQVVLNGSGREVQLIGSPPPRLEKGASERPNTQEAERVRMALCDFLEGKIGRSSE